jgi:cell division protein FtsI (penicillin-binding protein 3)
VASSSNIGAGKIAQRLGRERLQRTLLAFGFGERTGTGLPGEPRGQVPYPRAEVSLATMAFGQGVTASALQTTAAAAAIANGGLLLRPQLVRRVVDPVGARTLFEVEPVVVRRAASPQAAAQVARWMELVLTDGEGTGKRARLDGWRAAGKTGTAQKADPVSGGYSADKRFSSFVGFAPVPDPRVVVGVFIDEPRGEIYGGEVAAPVFKEVVEHALRALGVPPDAAAVRAPEPAAAPEEAPRPSVEAALRSARSGEAGVAVPLLLGLPARSGLKVLEAVGLLGETSGSGLVSAQSPAAGVVVERGSRVRLRLQPRG